MNVSGVETCYSSDQQINADTQGLRSPPSYEQYELQEVITQEGGQLKEGAREVPEHLELVSSWATQQDSGEPSQDTFETEAARTSEDSMMDPWCL